MDVLYTVLQWNVREFAWDCLLLSSQIASNLSNWEKEKMLKGGGIGIGGIFGQLPKLCGLSAEVW